MKYLRNYQIKIVAIVKRFKLYIPVCIICIRSEHYDFYIYFCMELVKVFKKINEKLT